MSIASLGAALAQLDKSVSGLDNAVRRLESKPVRTRRAAAQQDLFAGSGPDMSFDVADVNQRLDRVIARIEDVLQSA